MKTHLLVLAIAVLACCAVGKAAEFTLDGIKYSVSDYTHATVTGCENVDTDTITIPYTINYVINGEEYMFFVTKIAANAFADSKMTTLIFGPRTYSGATSAGNLVIEDGAFNTPTLKYVCVDRKDLPEVNGDPFNEDTYRYGYLSFGSSMTDEIAWQYLAVDPWKKFINVIPLSVDTVDDGERIAPIQYYSVSGVRIAEPRRGEIVIVRRGGNVSKLVVPM